jgi:nucleoside-diphosphate-sugar epimerase
MTASEPFATVTDSDRILVTGATGWLGRELIARLRLLRPEVPILAVASQHRTVHAGPLKIDAVAWDLDAISQWKPTIVVHLAFLTRELEAVLGWREYESRNRQLSDLATHSYGLPSIRAFVYASSGAAISPGSGSYGLLKAQDEERFREQGRVSGVPTVVARVWSVSGEWCPKSDLFALYDLIRQTRMGPVVHINAAHEVVRRYVDAGEYLEICLALAGSGSNGAIDSGGQRVELGELALRIQQILGIVRPIERPESSGTSDVYCSESSSMTRLARQFGVALSGLEDQIRRSARAVDAGQSGIAD